MLSYVIAGLVLGGIYAISAGGIVVTYVSTGVLNLAFGTVAYFLARLYYFLLVQHGWSVPEAAAFVLLFASPALGVLLYLVLFRFIVHSSSLIKVVSTIGLAVSLPPLAQILFGQPVILTAPGLAPTPVKVYHLFGTPVTMDQIITSACVIGVVVIGTYVLRFTDVGLRVRGMVDSPAMISLSGESPARVSLGVWAASFFLAGLAGVLAAPILNVDDPNEYVLVAAAAFAAVVAAKLRNLGVAVVVGLALGVVSSVVQWALPPNSGWSTAALPSVPFGFVVIFLVYFAARGIDVTDARSTGGTLDRALHVQGADAAVRQAGHAAARGRQGAPLERATTWLLSLAGRNLFLLVAVVLTFVLSGYEVNLVAEALAFAVVFLSYTLVAGEGNMIWLCQITFAGVGAIGTAELTSAHGWPLIPAMLVAGVIATVLGVIVGLLTVRMGDLFVALVTLTFGLLMDNLVLQQNTFMNGGLGLTLNPPGFASSSIGVTMFTLVTFCILGLIVYRIRASTAGMALAAIRSSQLGSRTVGLRVVRSKLLVSGFAAFVAAIGGALLALYNGAALPTSYQTLYGLVWLAVIVTVGVRSNNAAVAGGLAFVFLPQLFSLYLPLSWQPIPTALFGVGAIMVAKNPDGVIGLHARQLQAGRARLATLVHAGKPRYSAPSGEPDPNPVIAAGKGAQR
jgi:branched-chain amino acid transport system permease protein